MDIFGTALYISGANCRNAIHQRPTLCRRWRTLLVICLLLRQLDNEPWGSCYWDNDAIKLIFVNGNACFINKKRCCNPTQMIQSINCNCKLGMKYQRWLTLFINNDTRMFPSCRHRLTYITLDWYILFRDLFLQWKISMLTYCQNNGNIRVLADGKL